MRVLSSVAIFLLVISLSPAQTGKDRVAGNWKISFLDGPEICSFWLLKLESKNNKITGQIEVADKAPPADFKSASVKGDELSLELQLGSQILHFALKLPEGEPKLMRGTLSFQGEAYASQWELVKDDNAKKFEPVMAVSIPKGGFKELKGEIAKRANEMAVFSVARATMAAAVKEKIPPADLKAALAPALAAARNFGDFQRENLLQGGRYLAFHKLYAGLGEELIRKAIKELADTASPNVELRCLDLLSKSLMNQDKKDELAMAQRRIDALEPKGHEENEKAGLGFNVANFEGRKGKRVVLVELFTGAHCPPCVAADLAFEGLAKTYSDKEVVLLQYHLHVPAPDPLTTPETETRANYYAVKGTPSLVFNGKSTAGGGGYRIHAPGAYKEFRAIIDPLLEKDNKITLTIEANRKGDAVDISAVVGGYKFSDKLKLRIALIEPWVRFAGSNGLSYHSHVVRAFAGGPDGFGLGEKGLIQKAKIDLAETRQTTSKALDKFDDLDGQPRSATEICASLPSFRTMIPKRCCMPSKRE